MATNNAKVRKPLTQNVKGLICLIVLVCLTVFVSCLALAGLKLDAQGIRSLRPWVPTSSASWPAALPVNRTLGGGTFVEYAYTLPEGAAETALQDSANAIRARLTQMGESDAEVSVKDGTVRIELRKMDESRLATLRNFATLGGQFEFTDTDGNVVLTEKDIARADVNVNYNSTRTSYTVALAFTLNQEGEKKLAESNPAYLAITCDGDNVSSYASISGNKVSATVGYDNSAYNSAANLAFLLNNGAVDVTLSRSNDGDVNASAGIVLTVVLIVSALLVVCSLVYMAAVGKLTGVAGFLSVWCAVVLGLFFVATVVVPSVYMLNVGCLVAILLGILLAVYTAVTRTDAVSKQIGEGAAPKAATRQGLRSVAKTVWLVHGAALVLSLVLMIFSFSRSTGYALFAMVLSSAICTLVMRAFQGCFTMMSGKPSLFGKVK